MGSTVEEKRSKDTELESAVCWRTRDSEGVCDALFVRIVTRRDALFVSRFGVRDGRLRWMTPVGMGAATGSDTSVVLLFPPSATCPRMPGCSAYI